MEYFLFLRDQTGKSSIRQSGNSGAAVTGVAISEESDMEWLSGNWLGKNNMNGGEMGSDLGRRKRGSFLKIDEKHAILSQKSFLDDVSRPIREIRTGAPRMPLLL